MRNSRWLGWVALGVLGVVSAVQVCSSDVKKPPAMVRAEDLCNGNCIIVGRLGKPYGEISKVRGVWKYEENLPKPEGPSFRITHINGRKLPDDRQIIVKDGFVKRLRSDHKGNALPRDGEVLEGRAYESGGYPNELPPKARDILNPNEPPVQPPSWAGFAFHSFLYFVD